MASKAQLAGVCVLALLSLQQPSSQQLHIYCRVRRLTEVCDMAADNTSPLQPKTKLPNHILHSAGIVAPASILLANKGMVAEAEAANLAVLTYGRENNEPENVRKQAELGVKGAILDEVELVVSSIKEKSQTVGITKLDVGLAVLPTAVRVGA